MEPGTVVLLHSPLVGVESWGAVPAALRRGGAAVLAAPVDDDDPPPYAGRYVAQAAARVLETAPAPASPLVLAGHSGAGPLLPAVGAALRAGGRRAGGYLFCDAGLPVGRGPHVSRLDLLAEEDPALAAGFRAELEAGGRFPGWNDRDLAAAYDAWLDRAEALGWPTASLRAGHFHALVDPDGLAAAMLALLARM